MIHRQAVRILQQILEDGIMHLRQLPGPQIKQPGAPGSDPDRALAVAAQGSDRLAGQLRSGGERLQMFLLPHRQTGFRAHPKPPLPVLHQRVDGIRRESVLRGEGGEAPVLQADQPPAHAADPQRALAVPQQGLHPPGLKTLQQTERHKTRAVEAAHPGVAPHPNITILGLGQRAQETLRQPLLARPFLEREGRLAAPDGQAGFARFDAAFVKHKVAERGRDGHFAKRPPIPASAVAQADLIEGGVGGKLRRQAGPLARLGRARSQVRVQPHGHLVLAALDVLHFKNNRPLNALARQLVLVVAAAPGGRGLGRIQVNAVIGGEIIGFAGLKDVEIGLDRLENIERAIGPGIERVAHRQAFRLPFVKLEGGEVRFGARVRDGVDAKLEVERIGRRVVPFDRAVQNVRARPGLVRQRRSQIAPDDVRRAGGGGQRQQTGQPPAPSEAAGQAEGRRDHG